VHSIGIQPDASLLQVPTVDGIKVLALSTSAPNVALSTSIPLPPAASPVTNPRSFVRGGQVEWAIGVSRFNSNNNPTEAGHLTWNAAGSTGLAFFGAVPSAPTKNWVPAAGAHELAIVGNGTDAYSYFPLREPAPGAFFVKGSAVGAVALLGSGAGSIGTILCSDECGEPFAIPVANGTRVAIETSFGPPFAFDPPGGGERIVIVYSPLDPLGTGTTYGVLAVPAPLGGRISTRGMDRPIWTRDGTRVMAATSHFLGAPNPSVPGIEVLEVPANVLLDSFHSPHTVVVNPDEFNQSIVFPSSFEPRVPSAALALAGYSFFGNVFADGCASILTTAFGEIGQKQLQNPLFQISSDVPNFRQILPPSFNDAVLSLEPIPGLMGARRTSFNLIPGLGLAGLTMIAAHDDRLYLQPSGWNDLAAIGQLPPVPVVSAPLPAGWRTTTEFLSL
jgi:hypothetical protein